jgi:hypothetical protein
VALLNGSSSNPSLGRCILICLDVVDLHGRQKGVELLELAQKYPVI